MEGTMMQFMGWMVIPFSIKCIFPNVQKWSSEWLDFILTLLSFCKQNFFFAIHFFFHRNYKNSISFQKWLPHRLPRRPFMDQKRPKSLKPPYSISYSSSSYKLVRPPAAKRWNRPQLLEDTQCPFPGINRTEYFQKLKWNLPTTTCVLKKWLDKVDEFMNFVDEIRMYVIFCPQIREMGHFDRPNSS